MKLLFFLQKLPKNEIEINIDLIPGKICQTLKEMIENFSPELNRKYLTTLLDNTISSDSKRKRKDSDANTTKNLSSPNKALSSPKAKKISKKGDNNDNI